MSGTVFGGEETARARKQEIEVPAVEMSIGSDDFRRFL
jgi:hypothetical protein